MKSQTTKKFPTFVLALAAFVGSLGMVPALAGDLQQTASIFGRDDREVLPPAEQAQNKWMGYVRSGNFSIYGNGIIISPNCDVILTVAHIFFGYNGDLLKSSFMFVSSGDKSAIDKGSIIAGTRDWVNYRDADWAVAKLVKPIENCEHQEIADFRSLGGDSFDRGAIELLHFHFETKSDISPMIVRSCSMVSVKQHPLFRRNPNLIAHNCDDVEGSSGSGLRHRDSGKVIGINSGGFYNPGLRGKRLSDYEVDEAPNWGVPITPDIIAAANQLMAVETD